MELLYDSKVVRYPSRITINIRNVKVQRISTADNDGYSERKFVDYCLQRKCSANIHRSPRWRLAQCSGDRSNVTAGFAEFFGKKLSMNQ